MSCMGFRGIHTDFTPVSSKESLDIQATKECGFTLKTIRDMIITYSQEDYGEFENGNLFSHFVYLQSTVK